MGCTGFELPLGRDQQRGQGKGQKETQRQTVQCRTGQIPTDKSGERTFKREQRVPIKTHPYKGCYRWNAVKAVEQLALYPPARFMFLKHQIKKKIQLSFNVSKDKMTLDASAALQW